MRRPKATGRRSICDDERASRRRAAGGCRARSAGDSGDRLRPSASARRGRVFPRQHEQRRREPFARAFGDRTPHVELWDPMTGAIERLDAAGDALSLAFEPHGSRIVVFRKERGARAADRRRVERAASLELRIGLDGDDRRRRRAAARSICRIRGPTIRRRATSPAPRSYQRSVDVPAAFRAAARACYLDFGDGRPSSARRCRAARCAATRSRR